MCPANLCVDATKVTWPRTELVLSAVFQRCTLSAKTIHLRLFYDASSGGPVHLAGRIRPRSERLQTQIGPGPRRHQRQPAPVLPHREETTAQRRYGRSLPIFSIYVRL